MDKALFNLLCEIEEFLVQLIDNDPDFNKYDNIEEYINSKAEDIICLYHCFNNLADKFYGKEY